MDPPNPGPRTRLTRSRTNPRSPHHTEGGTTPPPSGTPPHRTEDWTEAGATGVTDPTRVRRDRTEPGATSVTAEAVATGVTGTTMARRERTDAGATGVTADAGATGATSATGTTTPAPGPEEWTDAGATGATTPLAAAQAPPEPDHPFESDNHFHPLRADESSDDTSRSSMELLTPADIDANPTAADNTIDTAHTSVDVGPPAVAVTLEDALLRKFGSLVEAHLAAHTSDIKETIAAHVCQSDAKINTLVATIDTFKSMYGELRLDVQAHERRLSFLSTKIHPTGRGRRYSATCLQHGH